MPRSSHKPIRTCLGCRRADEKSRMIRIAANAAGVAIDPTGKAAGRGGYLHADKGCFELFIKAKVREFRSLKRALNPRDRVGLVSSLSERLAAASKLE